MQDTESGYNITVEIDDRTLDFQKPIADPFHSTTVHISWRDLLRGLIHRGLRVTVRLSADRETIFKFMTQGKDVVDEGPAVAK